MNTAQGEADSGGPPLTQPAVRRITRSPDNHMIAGVAGGLAEHFNTDPLFFRVAFVLLSFAGGTGILLYLAAWVLIPERGAQASIAENVLHRRGISHSWAGIALVVAGVLLFTPVWEGDSAIFWAVALIAAGVLLYRSDSTPPAQAAGAPPPATQPPPAPHSPATAWQPVAAPRARRPRSNLGRYTVAATLLVLGGLATLDNLGAVSLDPGQYPALALVVIGGGLLVGTLWGRSRMLLLLGILVLPFATAGTVVNVPLSGGTGERSYTPTTPEDLHETYRLAAGQLEVDLSRMRWTGDPVKLDASVTFGELKILVPQGVFVDFDGYAGMGGVDFLGRSPAGLAVDLTSTSGPTESTARLAIDAEVSMGQVVVVSTTERFLEETR